MNAPTPRIVGETARQFWTPEGEEIFLAEAYGRHPVHKDSLRCFGVGPNRLVAERQAVLNWQAAWRSLRTKSRSTSDQ